MSIKISTIYTKSGDSGETALIGGSRISKASLAVHSYGLLDEVNAQLGVVRSWAAYEQSNTPDTLAKETEDVFAKIQNVLFDLGAILAAPANADMSYDDYDSDNDERVIFLETKIDEYRAYYEPINSFTVPGGCMLNAYAHVARTVCRHWERILVERMNDENLDPSVLVYANRLSDFLYAYSRLVTTTLSEKEQLWEPGKY